MNIRLGTDIVHIPRIKANLERFGDRFLHKIYTSVEQQDYCPAPSPPCPKYDRSIARLAGRWAAKEAVVKALGTGWQGIRFTDVEIQRRSTGEPKVCLYGAAAEIAANWGSGNWQLSLSHDGEYAIATALFVYDLSFSS